MTTTEKLLRDLIALPSVNPAFLPGNAARTGERRVADFLATAARRAGLDVKFQTVFPGRANLLARLSPRGKARRRILLAPHLDTVNATEDQFTPRTRNGRLYGRGACDTKGSVAAMFTALCEVARSRQRPAETEILFAGLVDEENGQNGSRALAASGLKAGRLSGSRRVAGWSRPTKATCGCGWKPMANLPTARGPNSGATPSMLWPGWWTCSKRNMPRTFAGAGMSCSAAPP